MLASGSLWEGIDIKGDTLTALILVKLPFSVPDPVANFERSLYGSIEQYKMRAVIPDMCVRLKQGDGRLVRSEKDTGVVAILDCRANSRGLYRKWVLSALPRRRVTDSIKVVKNFILSVKNPDYFVK